MPEQPVTGEGGRPRRPAEEPPHTAPDDTQARLRELERARDRYLDLFDAAPVGQVVLDEQGVIREANQRAAGMLGVERGRLLNQPLSAFLPDGGGGLREFCRRLFASARRQTWELPVRRPDGAEFRARLEGLAATGGGPRAGRVALIDVSDWEAREDALREGEERLRGITDAIPGAVFQCRVPAAGPPEVLFQNRGVQDVLGLPPDQVRADPDSVRRRVHPDDLPAALRSAGEAARAGQPWNHEFRYFSPDGSECWLRARAVPERQADGSVVWTGTLVDVSEFKRAAAERQRLEHKLQEASKLESLGVLAGGIAHDFNNLLAAVLGYANLAQAESPPGSPAIPYLEQVEVAALRAADLCKQMLAYAGQGQFAFVPLGLNELIRDSEELLRMTASRRAGLEFHLAPHLPAVLADAAQLRQVLLNLVLNASEALPEGKGQITVATGVTRAAREEAPDLPAPEGGGDAEYVWVEVSDTGCGMTEETRARMFDPFFTTKFAGRGLGLAAVLGIARAHKAAIRVYTQPGRGTTFRLLLPAAPAGAAEPPARPAPIDWRGEGTVLVVDDQESVRTAVAHMLQSLGFRTLEAPNGYAALLLFEERADDVTAALLDVTMPLLDGVETLRRLHELRPGLPVLLMSGYNEQEVTDRLTDLRPAGFIQKPFQLAVLADRLRAVLGA